MVAVARFLELANRQLRVALGRLDGRMAEQLLKVPKLGAGLEHVRGAALPEGVRRDRLLDICCRARLSDEHVGLPHGHNFN